MLPGSQLLLLITMAEIYVKVKTEQKEFSLEKGTMLQACLTEKAEKNRANTELVERLSDIFDKHVGLIEGHKKRRKKIKVSLTEEEVDGRIEEWQKHR